MAMAKAAFYKTILSTSKLHLNLRKKLVKCWRRMKKISGTSFVE